MRNELGTLFSELEGEDFRIKPEIVSQQKTGWGLFSEEVAWFLFDFFKYKLNDYEKIIFYSYYINGLTMKELGSSCCKSAQAIGLEILKINKKLSKTWKTRKTWKVKIHECEQSNKRNSRRDKKRS